MRQVDQCSSGSIVVFVLGRRGVERAKPKCEALDLPDDLCSNPYLWS